MHITKPEVSEYPGFNASYVDMVEENDLIAALKNSEKKIVDLVKSISEEKADHRYDSGKWSIKEIIIHLSDAERVFAYRALRFSRNDRTELSGFDENHWVPESNASARTLEDILHEFILVRQSSLFLFKNLTKEMSMRKGIANGKEVSVRAIGYVICGHALHHYKIIKERYLK
ncbi:MAG: DinB family protein [Bacteroidota bacterium]